MTSPFTRVLPTSTWCPMWEPHLHAGPHVGPHVGATPACRTPHGATCGGHTCMLDPTWGHTCMPGHTWGHMWGPHLHAGPHMGPHVGATPACRATHGATCGGHTCMLDPTWGHVGATPACWTPHVHGATPACWTPHGATCTVTFTVTTISCCVHIIIHIIMEPKPIGLIRAIWPAGSCYGYTLLPIIGHRVTIATPSKYCSKVKSCKLFYLKSSIHHVTGWTPISLTKYIVKTAGKMYLSATSNARKSIMFI